ncbi:MAG: GNAT family N-acetyltransferase [Solirubrobacteraceae bacterium]
MPSFRLPPQPFTDGHVALRLAAERDIPEILVAHQDDPEMFQRLGREQPPTGAQLGAAAERESAERLAGLAIALTILEPGDDVCQGRIDVHNVDWEHLRAELGVWVAPRLRGRGLARRALVLASGWLFDACVLKRLALITEPDNLPLLHAARAAGFQHEGLLRQYTLERGRRVDAVVLSLLPEDLQR